MYRRDLFTPVDIGYVWLNPEPEKPGLRGWDAACPRMVTLDAAGFSQVRAQFVLRLQHAL